MDSGPFAAGKQVTVEVMVWCWITSDESDLFYTTNAEALTQVCRHVTGPGDDAPAAARAQVR